MFNRWGYSSELYNVEISDIIKLKDCDIEICNSTGLKLNHPVVVNINDDEDSLICGRSIINDYKTKGLTHIPVQFVFKMKYKSWKIHITLIKKYRNRHIIKSSSIYHMNPNDIRNKSLERCFRNKENAYQHNDQKYYKKLNVNSDGLLGKLTDSIVNNGYDDKFPMDIRLCRSFGVQDTLNQGHHRMFILIDNNINRAAFSFTAAGYIGYPLNRFFEKLSKIKMKSKYKK